MRYLTSLLLSPFGLVIALPSSFDTPPKPAVGTVTYSGSGCPEGSVSFTSGGGIGPPGNYTLTFGLDRFTPYYGPGVSPRDKTKTCSIEVDFSVPEGWKLRVNAAGTIVHGFATFDSGIQAAFLAQYFIEPGNSSAASTGKLTIKGPINDVVTKVTEGTDGGYTGACGMGKLHAGYRHSITTPGSYNGPGWETEEIPWTLQTNLEMLRC